MKTPTRRPLTILTASVLIPAAALTLAACSTTPVHTQAKNPAAKKYARAEQFLGYNTRPLVDHLVRRVTWLDATHFWYVDRNDDYNHYEVMDAATGKVKPAFDQAALAAALNKLAGKRTEKGRSARKKAGGKKAATKIKPGKLRIRRLEYLPGGKLEITWHGKQLVCTLEADTGSCVPWESTLEHKPGKQVGGEAVAPNGKWAVFVRDWNLWLRNLRTGKETQLTTDGVKNYGYATGNAGWVHHKGAIVRWSPDSTRLVTYRQDQRKVGNMYTIKTRVGHPKLYKWKEALPGDKHDFLIQPVIVNVKTGEITRVKMPPQQRLSTLCDTLACDRAHPQRWSDVKWAPDGKSFAIATTTRNRQHVWLRVVDASTGDVRTVFQYDVKQYYESGHGKVNWEYLPAAGRFIWYSWKTNWGNLYLHSLETGKLLHPVTTGHGNVDEVRYIDRKTDTLWFVGNARTPGINPYFRQFFKVDIDTGKTTLLTPEPANHIITMSPTGKYFVDSYSTPTQPPVTLLRSAKNGHVIATVARADISRLKAAGWVPPEVFTVKARDGKTALYGMMFKPTNFDPEKEYPLIDYIYPGPQTGSVFTFSWRSARLDHQAMAELGFIVVAINGLGTPWRSRSFHHYWYGNMHDNTLPDQVAGIRQLAKRHAWIDLERVGIWGHSGGGFATADAMFSYPDFFKVGWAESGNHDNRNYEAAWGEKYQGLLVRHADGSTNYDSAANESYAANLEGHLMLVHGTMDQNVPISNTYLVAEALMMANKDFDMLILPNAHHGYGRYAPYITRRRWDYFVRYLAGKTPPHEYQLHPPGPH